MILIVAIFHYINWVLVNFIALSGDRNCIIGKTGTRIDSEDECKQAAKELGITYDKACDFEDCRWIQHGGCFHNAGNTIKSSNYDCRDKTCVYFNKWLEQTGQGGRDPPSPAVCRAGK